MKNRLSLCVCSLMALLVLTPPALADSAAAARFYQDGLSRFNEGDLAGAVIQLRNALQADRNMLAAQLLLARTYFEDGEIDAAETAFAEAVRMGVDRSEVVVPIARMHLARGHAQRVIDEIQPDGLRADVKAEVLVLRGTAYGALGRQAEADSSFQQARILRPTWVQPLSEAVPVLIAAGRVDEAEQLAREAVELAPDSELAWYALGSVMHLRGDLEGALGHYDQAIEQQPEHVDARVARAGLLIDLGRDSAAQADLDALEQAGLGDARAAYLRALLAERSGDPALARQRIEEVARLIDVLGQDWLAGREQFLMLGALSHHALGNTEKARSYLGVLSSRFPRNHGARRLLASVMVTEGEFGPARSILEDLLRTQPDDVLSLSLMGRVMLGLKRPDQAVRYFERSVQLAGEDTPRLHIDLGHSLMSMGERARAVASLEQAYASQPDNPGLATTLASLYLQVKQHDQALAVAQGVRDQYPDSPDAYNLLGAVLGARGELNEAHEAYARALALSPEHAAARLNLARVDRMLGNPAGARAALAGLVERNRHDHRAMFELGLLERAAGNQAEALRWLERAQAERPDDARIGLQLSEVYLATGQRPRALEVLKNLALRAPADFEVRLALARAHHQAGDARTTASVLRELTRMAEFDPARLVRVASMQLSMGNPAEAEYAVFKALQGKPDDLAALLLAAEIAMAQNKTQALDEALNSLRSAHPDAPETLRIEAKAAAGRGDLAGAVGFYTRLLERQPNVSDAVRLGQLRVAAGEIEAAKKLVHGWLSNRDAHPAMLELGAELGMMTGDWDGAVEYYDRLIAQGEAPARVYNNLANALDQLNDPRALEVARQAHALASTDPLVADTLGWLLVRQGQLDEGLRYLRDARLRNPDHPEIRYHLAFALEQTGQRDEALRELEPVLESGSEFARRDDVLSLRERLQ